ncbi:hypothetical protein LPJ73_002663, partial [Coemansia sp. RSA 2703]
KGGVLRGFSPALLAEIMQSSQTVAGEEFERFKKLYSEARSQTLDQMDEPSTGSTFLVPF